MKPQQTEPVQVNLEDRRAARKYLVRQDSRFERETYMTASFTDLCETLAAHRVAAERAAVFLTGAMGCCTTCGGTGRAAPAPLTPLGEAIALLRIDAKNLRKTGHSYDAESANAIELVCDTLASASRFKVTMNPQTTAPAPVATEETAQGESAFYKWLQTYHDPYGITPKTIAKAAWFAALASLPPPPQPAGTPRLVIADSDLCAKVHCGHSAKEHDAHGDCTHKGCFCGQFEMAAAPPQEREAGK